MEQIRSGSPHQGSDRPGVSGRLRPPKPRPADLRRGRLLQAVVVEDPAPVTVVCGPAGSGKTALLTRVAAEAAAAGDAVAWASLEELDSDPTVLWEDIITAIRAAVSLPPGARMQTLAAPNRYVAPTFVDLVLEPLAASPRPSWLALDDLHVVHSLEAQASLALLVRRLPEGVHLLIASRSDPPIGLPRLRVEGRIRELRAADLAFSLGETEAVLRRRHAELPEGSVRRIHERTEGWAAGITMASLAIDKDVDVTSFLDDFDGDDHAVADYLATEALAALPEDVLTFLQRTSVCSRMSTELAQRLSGRVDAATVLEDLVRSGAFTERLGRGRDRYRYHELFRTYLAADLRRFHPRETQRELNRIAGEWWAEDGEPLHAVEHLRRADDLEQLAAVAGEHVLGLILDGQSQAVSRTFERFGSRLRSVPLLALLGAMAAAQRPDVEEVDRWLAGIDLDQLVSDTQSPLGVLAASVALVRARFGDREDLDLVRLVALLDAADLTAIHDHELELYALYNRGAARGYLGRYVDAVSDLERAVTLADMTDRTGALVDCLSFLAGARTLNGELVEMRRDAERAVALARQQGWSRSVGLANAYVDLAWSHFLRAEQAQAATTIQSARDAVEEHIDADVTIGMAAVELFVVAASGQGTFEALGRFQAVTRRAGKAPVAPAVMAFAAPLLVRICLDIGEHGLARQFVTALSGLPDPGEPALLRSMLLDQAGRHDAARKELEPVLQGRDRCHVITTDIRVRILAASLEAARGNDARMHELVCEGMRLAEPVEVVQPFLEVACVRQDIEGGQGRFGRLEAFAAQIRAAASAPSAPAGGTRLTEAELAVLRELPSLMYLRDIAASRSLSVNTVKSHLRSIYRKLGVSGRREAVEEGRRRELL